MKSFLPLVLLTLGLSVSCGKEYTKASDPQLYVKVAEAAMPLTYNFPKIGAADQPIVAIIEITNTGNEDLTVTDIYMEEGGNPFITLNWEQSPYSPDDIGDFPLVIPPNLPAPMLQFLVVYDPEDGPTPSPTSTLVIESDDPDFSGDDGLYKIVFGIQAVGPRISLNRTSIVFTCATGCVQETITIDNTGTDILTIDSIDFKTGASEYAIPDRPALPIDLPVKGEPDYFPVTFDVRYCPMDNDFEDNNKIVIISNDFSNGPGELEIPITVDQAPAELVWTTDSPTGYFDFTSVGGTHKINVYNKTSSECTSSCGENKKCCGCPIQIQAIDITVDGINNNPVEAAKWYEARALDASTGDELTLPRAVKGGGALDFEVEYHRASGETTDRNGKMCVRYTAPVVGSATRCVDLISTSQCALEIAPVNTLLYFNSTGADDVKEKPVLLVNNGTAECVVSNVRITDKWDGESVDFSLKDGITGEITVPAFGIEQLTVLYKPMSEPSIKPAGFLKLDYIDSMAGTITESVQLQGAREQECLVPVADPGSASSYQGIKVGGTINLSGCSSLAGSCGQAIYDQGYIWFLMDRPEGSTAKLNLETGCNAVLNPDKAGDYTVGLMVYDGTDFYQSDVASVVINVTE